VRFVELPRNYAQSEVARCHPGRAQRSQRRGLGFGGRQPGGSPRSLAFGLAGLASDALCWLAVGVLAVAVMSAQGRCGAAD